jgi:hypothetical protein
MRLPMTGRRSNAARTHGRRICAVEVSPSEVDAGAELIVTCRISCPHGCDLRGQRVSIRNQHDAELASAELTEFDGEAPVTSTVALRAPLEVGEHSYRAVLAASETDGVLHEEISTPFSFATRAHAANVNVWGLPSATAAGERFRFRVGIKCSAGCKLSGRRLSIVDHEGEEVAAARLADDIWPGTDALHFAEMEAQAPAAPGDYQWQVRTPEWNSGIAHAAGSFTFAVKIVRAPDHEVTVEAFDSETQSPIKGAHVLLHPYRAYTDESGVAKLKVAAGRYKLFVSGFKYIAYQEILEVAGDVTTRAVLAVEPEEQEDYA